MIEADFQREYDIELLEDIDDMSYRRFSVLLGNLGPASIIANIDKDSGPIEDEDKAEDFLRGW